MTRSKMTYQLRPRNSPGFVVSAHQFTVVPVMPEGWGLEVFSIRVGRRAYQAEHNRQNDEASE